MNPTFALPTMRIQITAQDAADWAEILNDRNPLHADPDALGARGIGRGIVHPGPACVGYLMTWLLDSFPGGDIDSFNARFVGVVLAPSEVEVSGCILREETTLRGRLLHCSLELRGVDGIAVSAEASVHLGAGSAANPSMQRDHMLPTVYGLFAAQVQRAPDAEALQCGAEILTYAQLLDCVDRCAQSLRQHGLQRGMCVAVLSENCLEYTILQLAAAKLGVMVACLNWRLTDAELADSIATVQPRLLACSTRFAAAAARAQRESVASIDLGGLCRGQGQLDTEACNAEPEDGLLIIFTSGTTGRPRAAVISQRAQIARMELLRRDLGLDSADGYIAWSPMFHMGGSEHTLSSLMFGAAVVICDGLDVAAMAMAIRTRRLGWLLLVPATIEPLLAELQCTRTEVVGIKAVGCMADLVPTATMQAICQALHAHFLNSFGSTETGLPPLSGGLLAVDDPLTDLSKQLNSGCELRLVDAAGQDASGDAVGEAWVRGPTLFSGYWTRDALSSSCLRDGWYPMGDLFRRVRQDRYQFVGRSKYLIKSGGENIYPAEIERVLLDDPRVDDAAVVRKPDAKWGEVPVAFVVRRTSDLQIADVEDICRQHLAGFKRPKAIHFIDAERMPRSATGKIIREALEIIAQER